MNQQKTEIVVVGGGFGGLETAFYLRKLVRKRANITVISDHDRFLFKPNTIYIPFGKDPEKLMFGLEKPMRRKKIRFVHAKVDQIDPAEKTVRAADEEISYDYLVLATGASMRPEEIEGMEEHAETIFTPANMMHLRRSMDDLIEKARAGEQKHILFLVPPNNKCSGPLYEMVFMVDQWMKKKKVRSMVDISYATFEKGYIQAFGPWLDDYVSTSFGKLGISGRKESVVRSIEDTEVRYADGQTQSFDLLITFPPYIAASNFPNLPSDERGFIATSLETRQVKGHPDIYAVGDGGNYPVKQAFLALLQADAAAQHLAARVKGKGKVKPFEPTSMCVMEQFNTATFAQVPLEFEDGVSQLSPDAGNDYRLGSGRLWRIGKKYLGLYLPFRFKRGNPFHAGLAWTFTDMILKTMSFFFARGGKKWVAARA